MLGSIANQSIQYIPHICQQSISSEIGSSGNIL
jgi:hypothetical protein